MGNPPPGNPPPGGMPPPYDGTGTPPPPPPSAPPRLTISQITFSQLTCVKSAITFTVTNSGGQRLDYTITSKSLLPYTIDRTSGSLRGGQSDTINVTGIDIGGAITVSDAEGDTQKITVACL